MMIIISDLTLFEQLLNLLEPNLRKVTACVIAIFYLDDQLILEPPSLLCNERLINEFCQNHRDVKHLQLSPLLRFHKLTLLLFLALKLLPKFPLLLLFLQVIPICLLTDPIFFAYIISSHLAQSLLRQLLFLYPSTSPPFPDD